MRWLPVDTEENTGPEMRPPFTIHRSMTHVGSMMPLVITDSHHRVGKNRIVSMFPTRRPRSRLLEMLRGVQLACVKPHVGLFGGIRPESTE